MKNKLQKAVCKQCVNTKWIGSPWNKADDQKWEDQRVDCLEHDNHPHDQAIKTCPHKPAHQGALIIWNEQ